MGELALDPGQVHGESLAGSDHPRGLLWAAGDADSAAEVVAGPCGHQPERDPAAGGGVQAEVHHPVPAHHHQAVLAACDWVRPGRFHGGDTPEPGLVVRGGLVNPQRRLRDPVE